LKLATREWNNRELNDRCGNTSLPIIASYNSKIVQHITSTPRRIFMACNPEYPSENFSIPMGMKAWSSHTSHWLDCAIAVSRGVTIVEKHVKLDKDDPEAGWSLYFDEFEQMTKDIRWTEKVR